jgi:nucleoside-diphosphate-sugar epimerase
MMANEEVELTPCDQMWDYIYSEDAARAILLTGQRGENGKVYVIGSGEVHPLKEYIEKIAAIIGYTKEIGFGKLPYNDKQVMYLHADIAKLKDLGFVPKVFFEKGIEKVMGYHTWLGRI